MTSNRAGWFVLTQGGVMLALGATFMVLAESDTWATVGLVLGLLGGGGLGTGLSLLLFPDGPARLGDEPEWVVCLRCGQPGCTGEPCVNQPN